MKQHFPERLHAVSTMYMVLLQVGQLAAPLVALPLAHAYGWRTAAGCWAVVAAVLWFVAVPRSPAGAEPAPAPSHVHWRTPLVLGLIGLMAMTTLHVYTLVTWFPACCWTPG